MENGPSTEDEFDAKEYFGFVRRALTKATCEEWKECGGRTPRRSARTTERNAILIVCESEHCYRTIRNALEGVLRTKV
uniref:Uncharacterized protein n=1 Tax=Steinernema glaseri TaxID=37863 RepID=A0A1I7Y5U0_9BILA